MTSPLENLAGPRGSLTAEPFDTEEFAGLCGAGRQTLEDAGKDMGLESRFLLAYNAAHSLSLAALRRKNYRANNRYIVFQVLPHTLGLGPEVWRVLARAHELRNLAEYRGRLDLSEGFVDDLIAAAKAVSQALGK